jgi:4'-phosphopantetheinyl transferase
MNENGGMDPAGGARFEARRLPLGRIDPPPPGTADVWFLDLRRLGNPLHRDADAEAPFATPRAERTVRRFYTRLLLGAYLGLPGKDVHLVRSARGKPALDPAHHDRPLFHSVARSAGRCVVGVSGEAPVGVDLEPAARRPGNALGVARRYFSPAEAARLATLEPPALERAFMHTWACKEAVVKAGGGGIANNLCRFTVETDPHRPAALLDSEDDDADRWTLLRFQPAPGLVGVLAAPVPGLILRAYHLQPPGP